jgi:hypothetical protein
MIRTEDLKNIPDLPWSSYSQKEFLLVPEATREQLIRSSSPVKMFADEGGVLMVAGLYRPTLLSVPHFWALLTEHFSAVSRADLRTLVKILRGYLGSIETFIEDGNERAEKMAQLFGFEPTLTAGVIGTMQMRLYRRA